MESAPAPEPRRRRPDGAAPDGPGRPPPGLRPAPWGHRPEPAGGRAAAAAKRALDVALASVQLVLTAPLWVLVPLAVKLEDGGPVFYGQRRVGRGGALFTSWKFRSMSPRASGSAVAPAHAELERHRVTRVGRLLRATALDELPQLWNILRGDMSYVGPRALLPEEERATGGGPVELDQLAGFEERHSVRPGLTGLAQVRLPRDATHEEKVRHDLEYVRTRTLWLDVKLILVSVWISLRGAWPDVGRGRGSAPGAG